MDDGYSNEPTPAQIGYALSKMTPNQRAEAINNRYIGAKVYWETRFLNLTSFGQDPVMLVAFMQRGWHLHDNRNEPIVSVRVDTSQQPEFGDLRTGRRVNLWGTIVKIDQDFSTAIDLELDRFEIKPESLTDSIVEALDSQAR